MKRAAEDLPTKELDSGITVNDSLRISAGPFRAMAPHGRARNVQTTKDVFRVMFKAPGGLVVAFTAWQDVEKYFNAIKHGEKAWVAFL